MRNVKLLALSFLICLTVAGVSAQESGKIVFSNSMIESAKSADPVDTFKAGDPIYAMAQFDKSLLGIVGKSSAKKVNVEVFLYELKAPLYDYQEPSEMQLQSSSLAISGASIQKDCLVLDIVPDPGSMSAYGTPDLAYKKYGPKFDGPVRYAESLAKLEPGDHTIIVKVRCNYNDVSEGRFTLSGDDYSVFTAMSEDINAAASGIKTQSTVMPKAAMSDKSLEDEMVAAFTASQTYKDRIKGKVLRIVIIDPDWMIRRNDLTGVILHRYIRATIAVKNSDGTCTMWPLVTFQQDYVSDAFQATKFDGVGDPQKIPCENVGK